eukprot:CAMPEP_0182548214 /NCGR_PEP_ID=MMETSP1323-20130603/38500_1 /TAXON_ID=236787 /ORGANISM="Florenciella parvula, Strain RCC1693" /LENGTH=128 /DNA_ID=CAMNT_0024759589 /DNA_START=17 /DNA_END=405 /DNA_ORIENTATION=-
MTPAQLSASMVQISKIKLPPGSKIVFIYDLAKANPELVQAVLAAIPAPQPVVPERMVKRCQICTTEFGRMTNGAITAATAHAVSARTARPESAGPLVPDAVPPPVRWADESVESLRRLLPDPTHEAQV